MIAQVAGTLIHIVWCYLFVIVLNMEVVGLGIASNITALTMLVCITIHAQCLSQVSNALFCPNAEAFKNWGEYLKLSLPATMMLCAEWWAFEILTIISGIIGVRE